MATQTTPQTETAEDKEFDVHAQKGWEFFTKFLLSNVIVTIVTLLFIGLLTVWR